MTRTLFSLFAAFSITVSVWAGEPVPGSILKITPLVTLSHEALESLQEEHAEVPVPNREITEVQYLRVLYATTDTDGKAATASGLIMYPKGKSLGALPLLSYQHGAEVSRTTVPSREPLQGEMLAATLLFAANGYAVVAPDGLGLGDSNTKFHPIAHAASEASSAIDLLKAAKTIALIKDFSLSGELFLAGYSQGGHWTMALHRQLEATPLPGFTISASAPMAGPYDLSGTTLRESFKSPCAATSVYIAYGLFSMQSVYGNIVKNWSDAIVEPYADRLPEMFDGNHGGFYAYRRLPGGPTELLQPAFLKALQENPNHPFRKDLALNNVYDWAPHAPIFLIHSKADQLISYKNAEVAYRQLTRRGGQVELIWIPGTRGHIEGFTPAIAIAAEKFEKFRL